MKGPLPSWDRNVHYIVSRDFFKTNHEKLVSCGNQFDIVSKKVLSMLLCAFHRSIYPSINRSIDQSFTHFQPCAGCAHGGSGFGRSMSPCLKLHVPSCPQCCFICPGLWCPKRPQAYVQAQRRGMC